MKKLAERRKEAREKAYRLKEQVEWQIAEIRHDKADAQRALDEANERMASFVAINTSRIENSWKEISLASNWFLNSGLAVNLAGIWAMVSQKNIDETSTRWALAWFIVGVIAAMVAGAIRLSHSYTAWIYYQFKGLESLRRIETDQESSSTEEEENPVSPPKFGSRMVIQVAFVGSTITFFVIGTIVAAYGVHIVGQKP